VEPVINATFALSMLAPPLELIGCLDDMGS
jgi:hypothetical protein